MRRIALIIGGGRGERFWPKSRYHWPKQFLSLTNKKPLIWNTCARLKGFIDQKDIWVIIPEDLKRGLKKILPRANVIVEPEGRNTAPAIAYATLCLRKKYGDSVMFVLPADHWISDRERFIKTLSIAYQHAAGNSLVTIGIKPTRPDTGYGYIQSGAYLENQADAMRISRFVEKPDRDTAGQYLASGDYFWNSGMFMFQASSYLDALEQFAPAILQATSQACEKAATDADFIRLEKEAFSNCPSDSIDYAVMEHTGNGVVIPLDAGWNDVGSWSALWEIGDKDENGNVIVGDVLAQNSHNCYLRSDSRLLATVGIDDIMVIDTHDVVLVAHRDQVQEVKGLVNQLSEAQREEINIHALVHRPWGCYQGVDRAERYQVKRITVEPGAQLSLQMHHHRAEHWIVVRGTAKVTRGEDTFILSENQSTYIPIGEQHRLENPGKIPLEIIEVQSGSYLGEDDIERLEDVYGR